MTANKTNMNKIHDSALVKPSSEYSDKSQDIKQKTEQHDSHQNRG